ncbi:hypothetical protein N7539_003136 [Penicillium diatomitis]|uniref:MYND-type domain-containing protein n=1 Tax=Penicillium diatomitis TaxID=2819901 RepID=A0A9W9XG46_9EURO|nr:uncharacterized protein N7539_003136 [Penicillium diatomitis]KAJ5491569.1 hypothetical protein N7539_003136 [Penicillium diatomitis]
MIKKALPSGCAVCGHQDDLFICSGCKALPYCGRDCQIADRPAHKAACSAIKKARNVMATEEQKLRHHPGDVMMSKDPFTSCVGHLLGGGGSKRATTYTSLPYLDVKDADMFESVERFCHPFFDLSHRTCVCLLKIRLLLELVRLEQSTDSLGPSPHPVISAMLKSPTPISSAVGASQAIMSSDSNTRKAMIDTLMKQIDALYEAVQKANEHFWYNLTDPEVDLDNMPSSCTMGSVGESQLAVGNNFFTWVKTSGALAFIITPSS